MPANSDVSAVSKYNQENMSRCIAIGGMRPRGHAVMSPANGVEDKCREVSICMSL
jgi:hypothetical protein